jgi:putative CocE/NonD family hydrolase
MAHAFLRALATCGILTIAIPAVRAQAPSFIPAADAINGRLAPVAIALLATTAEPAKRYKLQLAAGLYAEAEATIDQLERASSPGHQGAFVPWRIYARARRYEASGQSATIALRHAFADLYGRLSDKEMADILPWYDTDLAALRAADAKQTEACKGQPLQVCPSAIDLVLAHQAVATWSYLLPESKALIRADAERRFVIDDRLLVPTPDGARIATILVRPRTGAKLVALLNFTIYANDGWSFADAVKMAAYGYAGAVAYTRGKGRSPGLATPYVHDGADATAVIDWLAKQRWSDGRVGMFSGSYNASTQWAAAKHHPRALKAIATNASNAPGIDVPMRGNVFENFFYPWPLYTTRTKGLDDATYGDAARWERLYRTWYASGRPYRDLDRIDGQPNPVFAEWLRHPSYDAYWQRLIPYRDDFARIDIPVFVETGYFDGGMVGALYYLQQHYRYRPSADHRLLVGPYTHLAMQVGASANVDGYAVDRAALIDLQAVRLQWFDHVFRGAPLPDILRDRINFEVMGTDRWRHVGSLADMATKPMRLYLGSRQDTTGLLFDRTPASDPAPLLRVDFANRSDAGRPSSPDVPDMRNALVYSTQPLDTPLEIDGLFKGHFTIIVNKRDIDLSVAFYERMADGHYLPLASYLGRASYRDDASRRTLLVPGVPQTIDFQSQTLTARRIAAGSRIVAIIAIPKGPDLQINYGSGKDVSDEALADAAQPLVVRWLPDSYLELNLRE